MGFPIFCRGFSIQGTAKSVLGLINHPVVFGGVIVHPGREEKEGILMCDLPPVYGGQAPSTKPCRPFPLLA